MAFTLHFKVDFRHARSDLSTSFNRLLEYMQEAALQHTQNTPYTMEWFVANKRGFLLTNYHVVVNGYPKWNDVITVETWPVMLKGLFVERAFKICNASGEVLAMANSNWVFADTEKRKPLRVPPEIMECYTPFDNCDFDYGFNMPEWEGYELLYSRSYTVMRYDTDLYNHANNVRYVEWIMDCVPDDIYTNCLLKCLKITYKKECLRGDNILIETWVNQKNPKEILFNITDKNDKAKAYAKVYTVWMA